MPQTFEDFGLDPKIVDATRAMGFETPTPIQIAAIPVLMEGHDVIGGARTGSGKTAAFGLPMIHKVRDVTRGVHALVLVPTRELAIQVSAALVEMSAKTRVDVLTIYGGASYQPQFKGLSKGIPIVVGTPGRIIDHLEKGSLDLSKLEMLVLDEADEMLRMGFIEDVERILEATPETRQIALFSATLPPPIARVAKRHLKNPVHVDVEDEELTSHHIKQFHVMVPHSHKHDALNRVLKGTVHDAVLVFARTRASCAEVAEKLNFSGIAAEALHGDLSQPAREAVLTRLRNRQIKVVVATDVAARGIDIDHITFVVNYDLPGDTETYVHRIGRTGRAGRAGMAITFVTPAESRKLKIMERELKATIPALDVPSDADIANAQQATLSQALGMVSDKELDRSRKWIESLVETGMWEVSHIAAAATALLARDRGVDLFMGRTSEPPTYVRKSAQRPEREDRPGRKDRDSRDSRPDRGSKETHRDDVNQVYVVLTAGTNQGIRVGDVVGAIANETGASSDNIGRISMNRGKTTVGMTRELADFLLNEQKSINLRGIDVRIVLDDGRDPKPAGKVYAKPRRDK